MFAIKCDSVVVITFPHVLISSLECRDLHICVHNNKDTFKIHAIAIISILPESVTTTSCQKTSVHGLILNTFVQLHVIHIHVNHSHDFSQIQVEH